MIDLIELFSEFIHVLAIFLFLKDPPGEAKDVEISKYDSSSVTLTWKPPTDDGGNPIQGTINYHYGEFH